MKICCVVYLVIVLFIPLSMNAKEALPPPPDSVELAAQSLAGKSDTEQLELLAFWKKHPPLLSYSETELDALYARNKKLIEQYAQSSQGDTSVRATCFELLRRHRNFAVTLPPQELKLTTPITGYEMTHNLGLIEFRQEWTLYRIAAAPNPQAKLEELKAQEPHNSVIFERIFAQKKSDEKAPESKPTSPAPSEDPSSSARWPVVAVVIVAALGLLWVLLKKRK